MKKLEVASLADILNYNDVKQNQESTIDSDKEVQRFAHTLVGFINVKKQLATHGFFCVLHSINTLPYSYIVISLRGTLAPLCA